jgi:hypothetical protein
MLKKILIGIGVVLIVFLLIVALQRADYRIVRTAMVAAPAAAVFAEVNDFHNWEAWSPWAKLDPTMKQAYDGPSAGTGAIYSWTGNDKVGEGRMTLTESHTNDLVRIKLEFIKPFASVCDTEFTFKPDGNQTAVTWSMSGTNNFVAKAFCLFMNMDKTVGGDFEKGLAQMKSVAETATKK